MPIEEKYGNLLDEYLIGLATDYAVLKEQGAVDKAIDLFVKA